MRESALKRLAARAGSTRWSPWLIAVLAGGAVAADASPDSPDVLLVVPVLALACNLGAAIAVNRRFHGRAALFVFHVALLACILLVLAGRAVSLHARLEIPVGLHFEAGDLQDVRRGPLHDDRWLDGVHFEQGPFSVDYAAGLKRVGTRSRALVAGPDSAPAPREAGDTRPFALGPYRMHTTVNKGFAVLVTWIPQTAAPIETGFVHLPSFPLYDWGQFASWETPAGQRVELEIDPPVQARRDRAWTFDSASASRIEGLTVRFADGTQARLGRGEVVSLSGGALRFERAGAWVGYRVSFDPTLPWLLSSALVGLAALGWHILGGLPRRLRAAGGGDDPVSVRADPRGA